MARKRRLNITVLEELYQELEPFRDRINISAVCEKALEREVARLKAGDLGPRIQAVIERLQAERGETFHYGYRLGVAYAEEKATLDDFQWLESHPQGRTEDERWPDGIGEELRRAMDVLRAELDESEPGPITIEALQDGFIDGMLSVWAMVKPYLPGGVEG
jgi:hypothetical protein